MVLVFGAGPGYTMLIAIEAQLEHMYFQGIFRVLLFSGPSDSLFQN